MSLQYKGVDISDWLEYQVTNKYPHGKADNVDEFYYDAWYLRNELAAAPLTVSLSITDHCNMSCTHCSKKEFGEKIGYLSFYNYKIIIDKLVLAKVRRIVLTGGEPLLHDNICEMIKYAKKGGLHISILTNLNCKRELLTKVLGFLDDNDTLQVSIDNVYEKYEEVRAGGCFELLESNCKVLIGSHPNIVANMVVTDNNVANMVDVLDFCESMHFYSIRFTPVFSGSGCLNPPSDSQAFNYFTDVLKKYKMNNYKICIQSNPVPLLYPYFSVLREKYANFKYETSYYRCPAAVISFEVDIQGDVYPCTYLIGKTTPFGNIYINPITEIWNSKRMNEFRCATSNAEQCKKCDEFKKCMGGCKAESYKHYALFDKGDNTCFLRKGQNEI